MVVSVKWHVCVCVCVCVCVWVLLMKDLSSERMRLLRTHLRSTAESSAAHSEGTQRRYWEKWKERKEEVKGEKERQRRGWERVMRGRRLLRNLRMSAMLERKTVPSRDLMRQLCTLCKLFVPLSRDGKSSNTDLQNDSDKHRSSVWKTSLKYYQQNLLTVTKVKVFILQKTDPVIVLLLYKTFLYQYYCCKNGYVVFYCCMCVIGLILTTFWYCFVVLSTAIYHIQ